MFLKAWGLEQIDTLISSSSRGQVNSPAQADNMASGPSHFGHGLLVANKLFMKVLQSEDLNFRIVS